MNQAQFEVAVLDTIALFLAFYFGGKAWGWPVDAIMASLLLLVVAAVIALVISVLILANWMAFFDKPKNQRGLK